MKKIAGLLLATLLLTACPSSDTSYGKAIKVGIDVTDGAHTAADTVDKLRLNGTVTKEEEVAVLHILDSINTVDTTVYGPCVQSAHLAGDSKDGFVACANSLARSLSDPGLLNSVRISNAASQEKVKQLVQAVINVAEAGVTAIGAVKGK